jgi:hypothetical protein
MRCHRSKSSRVGIFTDPNLRRAFLCSLDRCSGVVVAALTDCGLRRSARDGVYAARAIYKSFRSKFGSITRKHKFTIKTCKLCKQTLPRSEFYNISSKIKRSRPMCKRCFLRLGFDKRAGRRPAESICLGCGSAFRPMKLGQRHCNKSCCGLRQRAINKARTEATRPKSKECESCGVQMRVPRIGTIRKMCDPCRYKAYLPYKKTYPRRYYAKHKARQRNRYQTERDYRQKLIERTWQRNTRVRIFYGRPIPQDLIPYLKALLEWRRVRRASSTSGAVAG